MPYFVQADLEPFIPAQWMIEALDDANVGTPDSFAAVQTAAQDMVNGILSVRFAVPLTGTNITPLIKSVTVLQAIKICYSRRALGDSFPFKQELTDALAQLRAIAKRDADLLPVEADVPAAEATRGSIITGAAKTHSESGLLSV